MRRVTIPCRAADGSVMLIDTVGLIVPSAPGLLITPYHVGGKPVRRFTLTHEASGRSLIGAAWCPHDARRWADTAGWLGVDWRAEPVDVTGSMVAYLFVWRLVDEFRPHCDACPALPVDRASVDVVALARRTALIPA